MNCRTKFLITALVLLILESTGYSKLPNSNFRKYSNQSAKELLAKSENYCRKKRWQDARNILRYIEDYLPSSTEFPKAKLLLADSFFLSRDDSYPEAILEYTNYLNLFPNTDKKAYVLYQIGLCHYASIKKLERDQTNTKDTIAAFQALLQEIPDSIYATDAKTKIFICQHRLAETELRIGIYYVKIFKYKIAEKRLKYLIETYPNCVDYERAYYYLAESLYKNAIEVTEKKSYSINTHRTIPANDTESNLKIIEKSLLEAKFYYEKLIEKYPTGKLATDASRRLSRLKI